MTDLDDRSTRELALAYLSTTITMVTDRVDVEQDLRFFDTHFTRGPRDTTAPVSITVRRDDPTSPPTDAEPVYIRKSVTEFFTVRARRWTTPGQVHLHCETSGATTAFDLERGHVDMRVPGERPGRELIELVRSIVLRREENRGVVMVHAAVVELDGRAVVIVGPKGAGKTSSALELIFNHGARMVSGDKALLVPGGNTVAVAGWPDWPHLGLGTISRFPRFKDHFDLDDALASAEASGDIWSMRHKLPLDPSAFRTIVPFSEPARVLPVAAFLYPAVGPAADDGYDICPDHRDRLAGNVESAFASGTHRWNPLVSASPDLPRHVEAGVARAATCPAYELWGSGTMGPDLVSRLVDGR